MLLNAPHLTDYVTGIFLANGSEAGEATSIARHLVASNLAGHESHGVVRVPRYVKYVEDGEVVPNRKGTIAVDGGSLLVIDGNGGFGQPIGEEAVRLGIARARER